MHNTHETDVLFQKLGNDWYVFSESAGEVIFSQLPHGMNPRSTKLELSEVVEAHMIKVVEFQAQAAA